MHKTTFGTVAKDILKDPRTNIICDFEGDDDDAKEYGEWRRNQHLLDEYPRYVDEDDVYDEDSPHFQSRGWSMEWGAEEDENDIAEYERSLGFNYDDRDWIDYIDHPHLYRPRQCRWAYSFKG